MTGHEHMFARVADGVVAGAVAAVLSGAPSTLHAIATRANPLEATLAAGTLLRPDEQRSMPLVLAAIPTHAALSLGWGVVLAFTLPARNTTAAGVAGGLAIAALDLGLIGRRYPRIRALPTAPQVADHAAFGGVVGAVLGQRRGARFRKISVRPS